MIRFCQVLTGAVRLPVYFMGIVRGPEVGLNGKFLKFIYPCFKCSRVKDFSRNSSKDERRSVMTVDIGKYYHVYLSLYSKFAYSHIITKGVGNWGQLGFIAALT